MMEYSSSYDDSSGLDLSDVLYCPCPPSTTDRFLQANATSNGTSTNSTDTTATEEPLVIWEVVFASVVVFIMFVALVSDRLGADSVMITTLTAFMASGIITVAEGLVGFSNEGLLTVMVLFVVAQGINKTGALDWYMSKLLGRPTSAAAAQIRLMVPMAIVSAFLNNVPIVAVMIPIVQKWAKNIRISVQQLMIPLSFATILGGTCTLIGTSTNLVVAGLMLERYPNDPAAQIGLFDIGVYGVPVAMAGMTYILLLSPFLLPGGVRGKSNQTAAVDGGGDGDGDYDGLLLGARMTSWSPAVGRSVKRSGLRDTGGIYLVSVHRAVTGNVHRAVSGDFILNAGDVLWFTGLVETFGEFCNEHGLEIVVAGDGDGEPNNNKEPSPLDPSSAAASESGGDDDENGILAGGTDDDGPNLETLMEKNAPLNPIDEDDIPKEVGCTKESLLEADEAERLRSITRMSDLINGFASPSQHSTKANRMAGSKGRRAAPLLGADPANIVVAIEKDLVVVGISCHDRPGLMLDISKGLLSLNLQLKHTEAAVVDDRSISIWRCEVAENEEQQQDFPIPDLEEVWSVLNALLSQDHGVEAIKQRGLRVIRARVMKESRLINKTAPEVDFRERYRAAIVAVQSGGKNLSHGLSAVRFSEDDILILQARDDSALLKKPPEDFYTRKRGLSSRESSVKSLVNLITRKKSNQSLVALEGNERIIKDSAEVSVVRSADPSDDIGTGTFFIPSGDIETPVDAVSGELFTETVDEELAPSSDGPSRENEEAVWRDLHVLFAGDDEDGGGNVDTVTREFLTAMQVSNAKWAGKSTKQVGLQKLPDVFLVSIDRPIQRSGEDQRQSQRIALRSPSDNASFGEGSEFASSVKTEAKTFRTIDQDEPLKNGDILWFSGAASAVGDLRKIPGLISYQDEEVKKMKEHVHDRRLVQAVISRKGPLVGKTVKETRFRTRYGAAVIAVHREGKRVHEHPGNVKLQAGDVLLLEAGPSFLAKTAQNDRSFALLAEVEDSAPPRLRLLIPALVLAVLMLVMAVAEWLSLLVSALCASILMVAFGIISEQEARDALHWDVYLIIAAAFGIGTALENSGVSGGIATFLVSIGTGIGMGDAGLLGAIYFATFLISSVLTNNAAAALLFPIAMDAAEQTGTDVLLMSYTLMLGASASFMTPYGYTTNLLIYGAGKYKYTDFLYFGFPMQIVLWILSIAFLVVQPWYISWIGTGFVLLFVIVVRFFTAPIQGLIHNRKAKRESKSKARIEETSGGD